MTQCDTGFIEEDDRAPIQFAESIVGAEGSPMTLQITKQVQITGSLTLVQSPFEDDRHPSSVTAPLGDHGVPIPKMSLLCKILLEP